MEEITPKESVIPVFLSEITEDQIESMRLADEEIQRQEKEKIEKEEAKKSAQKKLSALGLTDKEVIALIG